jgi:hypothetical protein
MRTRWYLAGSVLAVFVVGACSHTSGDGGSGALSEVGGGQADRLAPVPSKAPLDDLNGGAGAGGLANSPGGAAAVPVVLSTGYKIQVARMTVAVKGAKNVATKADDAATIAIQAGGEVDTDNRTSGPHASASLLLRVPPEALTDTLNALSKLGIEQTRSLSSTDVTQKVADVSSRVRSAQQSIARLRVLFDHASKIGDIIQLESELNAREADLESLQAQQRSLAQQTSMASITLSLVTATKAPAPSKPDKDDDSGFVGGLKRGWDGFTGAAAWIAEAVGTLLPFIALLLVLGVGLRFAGVRLPRMTRRTSTPAPAAGPAE